MVDDITAAGPPSPLERRSRIPGGRREERGEKVRPVEGVQQ
jgi:hypothetical protein